MATNKYRRKIGPHHDDAIGISMLLLMLWTLAGVAAPEPPSHGGVYSEDEGVQSSQGFVMLSRTNGIDNGKHYVDLNPRLLTEASRRNLFGTSFWSSLLP